MQKGFATLEVILMVMVIGILASIAVPRFTSVTAAANTAKIQSDLSTIDTAIAIYQMEKGSDPTTLSDLTNYLRGADGKLKPPSGKCYMGGDEPTDVPEGDYDLKTVDNELRAVLGTNNKTAEDFFIKKSSSGGSGSGGGSGSTTTGG